jgi:hypothetical protein
LFVHPIAGALENWWKQHGGVWDDPEWKRWVDKYDELMAVKNKEMLTGHENIMPDGRNAFGMAKSIGCTRATALSFLGYDKEEFSGSTKFTFWLGHNIEVAALATLHCAGWPLLGTQIPSYLGNSMASTSDASIKLLGSPTLVSVKSTAYKMSGFRNGKWLRRGFPELPFEGIKASQPGWYVQLQAELAGSGLKQGLFLIVSKDIMKVFENDPFLGKGGNASLTFYIEYVSLEQDIAKNIMFVHDSIYDIIGAGVPSAIRNRLPVPPLYMNKDYQYVELEKANVDPKSIWGGPNQKLTGTFNPCGGCNLIQACKEN